jgi:hypothetical protein
MSRSQWEDKWSVFPAKYGLGTASGSFDGWDWFGHNGGFPGHITRTAVVPGQRLSISCLSNAADGMGPIWADGALAILKRFADEGAPDPQLADWRGRWWSGGALDLLPVGQKVLVATPGLANPIARAPELTVGAPDEATISQASAFASYGEPVRLVRGPDGAVQAVMLAGTRMVSEAELAAEFVARYERA